MRIVGALSRGVDGLAARLQPAPSPEEAGRTSRIGAPAAPIRGVDLAGTDVELDAGAGTRLTLAFLTGSCTGCQVFWTDLATGAGSTAGRGRRLVVVTPDPATESRRGLASLTSGGVAVVMSSRAWFDYGAAGAPWFALVTDGVVAAEGHATTWSDVWDLAEPTALGRPRRAGPRT
jgi:hypothetical protein